MLTASAALALAITCAPRVSPDTLLSFAYGESHFRPLAIHDNATGRTIEPATQAEAELIAATLITEGHRPDLGFMQISSANLARAGLTISSAFDPCSSMRAGAEILTADWLACTGGRVPADLHAAFACAASRYNTGNPTAGIANGYSANLFRVAGYVVPSIAGADKTDHPIAPATPAAPSCAPAWDPWAVAECNAERAKAPAAPAPQKQAVITLEAESSNQ